MFGTSDGLPAGELDAGAHHRGVQEVSRGEVHPRRDVGEDVEHGAVALADTSGSGCDGVHQVHRLRIASRSCSSGTNSSRCWHIPQIVGGGSRGGRL
jgi:hypothetical protein